MIELTIEDVPIKVGDTVNVFDYEKIIENCNCCNFDMMSEDTYNILNKKSRVVDRVTLSKLRNGDKIAAIRIKSYNGLLHTVYYPYECEPSNQYKVQLL